MVRGKFIKFLNDIDLLSVISFRFLLYGLARIVFRVLSVFGLRNGAVVIDYSGAALAPLRAVPLRGTRLPQGIWNTRNHYQIRELWFICKNQDGILWFMDFHCNARNFHLHHIFVGDKLNLLAWYTKTYGFRSYRWHSQRTFNINEMVVSMWYYTLVVNTGEQLDGGEKW